MYPDDPKQDPSNDPRWRPSQLLLLLMAVGIALAVTLLGALILYLGQAWTAQPLG